MESRYSRILAGAPWQYIYCIYEYVWNRIEKDQTPLCAHTANIFTIQLPVRGHYILHFKDTFMQ